MYSNRFSIPIVIRIVRMVTQSFTFRNALATFCQFVWAHTHFVFVFVFVMFLFGLYTHAVPPI